MENFATRREGIGREAKGNFSEREVENHRGICADSSSGMLLFSAEGTAGLAGLVCADHSAFSTRVSD